MKKLNKNVALATVVGSVVLAGNAHAVAPDVSAFTGAASDASDVATTMFTVIAPVIAGIVILKLAIRIGKSMLSKAA